jgi:hypothetical protein
VHGIEHGPHLLDRQHLGDALRAVDLPASRLERPGVTVHDVPPEEQQRVDRMQVGAARQPVPLHEFVKEPEHQDIARGVRTAAAQPPRDPMRIRRFRLRTQVPCAARRTQHRHGIAPVGAAFMPTRLTRSSSRSSPANPRA